MTDKTQTKPKYRKIVKTTPERFADMLNTFSECLTRAINRPDCKPDDPANFYYTRVQLLKLCRKNAKKYLDINLLDLPTLTGPDYNRGMIDLVEWIEYAIETVNNGDNEQDNQKPPEGERSKPLAWNRWAGIFGVSTKTLRKAKDNGQYHFHKITERRWTLPLSELPAEYLEKYRSEIAKRPKLKRQIDAQI